MPITAFDVVSGEGISLLLALLLALIGFAVVFGLAVLGLKFGDKSNSSGF